MYGWITGKDAEILELGLDKVCEKFPEGNLNVLEVGVREGNTARGMKEYLSKKGRQITYFGVDNQKDMGINLPFEEANLIIGDSTEVYNKVPEGMHFIFIDACHCNNHVILDFSNYSPKACIGGFVMLHDINPQAYGSHYQGHGPKDQPDFGVAARAALEKLGLYDGRPGWKIIVEGWESNWGGMIIFQKELIWKN